jgi:hypothetical protein
MTETLLRHNNLTSLQARLQVGPVTASKSAADSVHCIAVPGILVKSHTPGCY